MSAVPVAAGRSAPGSPVPMPEEQQGRRNDVDTAMKHDRPCEEEVLLQGFHELETPEGFRAEFIEGEIVVSPPPGRTHERAISRIIRQIVAATLEPMDFSGHKGLELARVSTAPRTTSFPTWFSCPTSLICSWGQTPGCPWPGSRWSSRSPRLSQIATAR